VSIKRHYSATNLAEFLRQVSDTGMTVLRQSDRSVSFNVGDERRTPSPLLYAASLLSVQINDVASFLFPFDIFHFRQQMGRYIPFLARIRDDGDSLLVEFHKGADLLSLAPWLEADLISWRELHHFLVSMVRLQELEPLDNSMIQFDQFFLSQLVDIDFHSTVSILFSCERITPE
jgi:hypothetical protein